MYVSILRSDETSQKTEHASGMKCAGVRNLITHGIQVPPSVALSTEAFLAFMKHNQIWQTLAELQRIDCHDISRLNSAAKKMSNVILAGEFPKGIAQEVQSASLTLSKQTSGENTRFAVRSSCNYEDLKDVSFAGMYSSYLNVVHHSVLDSIKKCYASLYSPRSLSYLHEQEVDIRNVHMGILLQPFIHANAAGTIFTANPTSRFIENIYIEGVWGLGEGVVSGAITPHSWTIFKRNMAIIGRSLGNTEHLYTANQDDASITLADSSPYQKEHYCLSDEEVLSLATQAHMLEQIAGYPLDLEWVKSKDNELFFLQMRPLTIQQKDQFIRYNVTHSPNARPLLQGLPITDVATCGNVRIVEKGHHLTLTDQEILVTKYLDIDWLPFLKNVKGIIVEGGGYTSHISIILREHNIPTIFGAEDACKQLTNGQPITLECTTDRGVVWDGLLDITCESIDIGKVKKPQHKVCVVTSTMANLEKYLRLPISGIGLVRLEFIIHEQIGIHPQALIDYDRGTLCSPDLKAAIEKRTLGYCSKKEFYIEKLTEGICNFASRCPDQIVNVRVPDFISDDYLSLLGGQAYEHVKEANPMMGWRGTTRLIDEEYRAAFELDCEAYRRAIDCLGFNNIKILVPFCRTPEDARQIRKILKEKGPQNASIGMMVEIPSNVMLARKFADVFDFFLIGPMDLTQLTYGADRTSEKMAKYSNETEAVKEMVKCFFYNIRDCAKDVFIGGWPLFQYIAEYNQVKGNNRIHLVELPDRLLELFDNVNKIEAKLNLT